MTVTVLKTSHGALYSSSSSSGTAGHGLYLKFVISNAPACFWDAIKELNDGIVRAGLSGHQILINQGCFLRMHGAHVQVRLNTAADLEKLMFSRPPEARQRRWADDDDDDDDE